MAFFYEIPINMPNKIITTCQPYNINNTTIPCGKAIGETKSISIPAKYMEELKRNGMVNVPNREIIPKQSNEGITVVYANKSI